MMNDFVPYGERFEQALVYAAQLHQGQKRKGTQIPYITHLLAVAAIVGENGGTEDEVIAALLHDAAEDQGGEDRLVAIRARFGHAVAEIVVGCTDTFANPKPAWPKRKKRYIEHLASAPPSVLLVSAADKLHNARTIVSDLRVLGPSLWGRFNGGKEGTLWYYRALSNEFSNIGHLPVVAELHRVVTEMERLAEDTAPHAEQEETTAPSA